MVAFVEDGVGRSIAGRFITQLQISSNTPEGQPSECPVCRKKVWIAPSQATRDATCPHCGSLLWFDASADDVEDPVRRLAELGVEVEVDGEGQVQAIRFSGPRYNDAAVDQLGKLIGMPKIDIRNTAITLRGAARLRRMLPDSQIEF